MKYIWVLLIAIAGLASCVPAKKYNELLEKERACNEDITKFKDDALNYEADAKNCHEQYDMAKKDLDKIKLDSTQMGRSYRNLRAKYDHLVEINEALETTYGKLQLTGAQETANLTSELQAKMLELQRREDELRDLESEVHSKGQMLKEREQRVAELEELLSSKEEATKALKEKVASALKGFENKGLTIVEKNGKIYVSLESKLLFPSGSTVVEENGKAALVQLAEVLQEEKDLEVIVEGHTDTDKLESTKHPKDNWELSVLRSTAVINILLNNSTMSPQQIMAAGRSEFHPVDAADKAKNRRIEIIIAPNLNELYELISKD